MRIKTLPAKTGTRWLMQAFQLLKKQPIRIAAAVIVFFTITVLTSNIPTIGPLVSLTLSPMLSLCLCSFFRAIDGNSAPTMKDFFAPFQMPSDTVMRLVLVGIIHSMGCLVLLYLTSLIDGGLFMQTIRGTIKLNDPALKGPVMIWGAMSFMALLIPFQAALWYAPQFVGWHNLGILQSLFYSFVAVWRNRGAFLNFAASWIFLSLGAVIAYAIVGSLMVALVGKAATPLAGSIQVPGSIFLSTLVYGAFWYSYTDILVKEDRNENENEVETDLPS
jgi:hypothetical protein